MKKSNFLLLIKEARIPYSGNKKESIETLHDKAVKTAHGIGLPANPLSIDFDGRLVEDPIAYAIYTIPKYELLDYLSIMDIFIILEKAWEHCEKLLAQEKEEQGMLGESQEDEIFDNLDFHV